MEEILILAEHRKGELREITLEMEALARRLGAENDCAVTTLLLGHETGPLVNDLRGRTPKLLVMESPDLQHYSAPPYLAALSGVMEERNPALTLIAHTSQGMDLAPALAARLSLPLVTDCVDLSFDDQSLSVLREIYGGKIHEHLALKPADRIVATIRPGSTPPDDSVSEETGVEEIPSPDFSALKGRRFLEYLFPEMEDVDIASAEILVSVGRGIGKPENLPVVEEFADTIGATLSCSRPVADNGWLPKSRQVGTSGKTVKPKIYLALGISGAFQHQAGMKGAGTIIAVNKDPKAPIFNVAHYGIVADLFQVLPVLKEQFAN